jgi:pyruvate/2-oxoglutarate/acetoin dehydrogenase E1 component
VKYIESINKSLHDLFEGDDKIFLIGEDLLDPYGGAFKASKGLSTKFPERVFSTPISESGFLGFSIGMALQGYLPIIEIMFGDFLTLCSDQIVNHASKFKGMYNNQVNVPIVIRTPMGGGRGYGPTHSQSIESMFLNVPGLFMVSPSIFHKPGDLLAYSVTEIDDPVLFIENKLLYPEKILTDNDLPQFLQIKEYDSEISGFPTMELSYDLSNEPDIVIIAYSRMATLALEVSKILFYEDEILINIAVPSLLKPVPSNNLISIASRAKGVLVLEEGVETGGWGCEVASQLNISLFNELKTPVHRLGALDSVIPCAHKMEERIFPNKKSILKKITEIYRKIA